MDNTELGQGSRFSLGQHVHLLLKKKLEVRSRNRQLTICNLSCVRFLAWLGVVSQSQEFF